jgi:hypothetical protein
MPFAANTLRRRGAVFIAVLYPACPYLGQVECGRQGAREIGGESTSAWLVTNNKARPRVSQALVSVFNNAGVGLVERNAGYQE